MDIVAVGFPSQLTAWGFSLLEFVCRRIAPDVTVVYLDRHDRVTDLGTFPGVRLLLSSFPNPQLAEECLVSECASICFSDEFAETLHFHKYDHGVPPVAALRAVSAGLILALPFMRSDATLLVRRVAAPYRTIVAALLSHAGFAEEAVADAVDAAVAAVDAEGLTLDAQLRKLAGWPDTAPHVTEEEADLAHVVLGDLMSYGFGGDAVTVVWPRECFLSGDNPDTHAPTVSVVTGRARIIYYGPYYHLPAGIWNVSVVIGFSNDIRDMPFTIEVASTTLLGRGRILAQRGGIFSAEFQIEVKEAHEAIEVRIMNDQGAIEGRIALARINFSEWQPMRAREDVAPLFQSVAE